VSNNLVTVNQNATASSSVTTSGTIQSNYTQIIVTSATGIAPGMAISGNYLPADTQVVAVSGTTITLSSTVDATQFYSVIGSFVGTPTGNIIKVASNASGSVGQIIANSDVLPLFFGATITSIGYGYIVENKITSYSKFYTTSLGGAGGVGTVTFSIYQFNSIPSATYTFTATDRNYTFRDAGTIPYGSYPGVGQYFT
jgi:hypothetical protein